MFEQSKTIRVESKSKGVEVFMMNGGLTDMQEKKKINVKEILDTTIMYESTIL